MNRKKVHSYRMVTRVAGFGVKNLTKFPQTTAAGEILGEIVTTVDKMSEHAVAQVSAAAEVRRGSKERKDARGTLKTQLDSMAQTARALSINGLWMPSRLTEDALIDLGYHFAGALEPLKTEFIKHGMAPDFIEALKCNVERLKAAIHSCEAGKSAIKVAISEYDQLLENGSKLLKRFDALVSNSMAGNPSLQIEWKAARRVDKVPQKGTPELEPVPAAPAGEEAAPAVTS